MNLRHLLLNHMKAALEKRRQGLSYGMMFTQLLQLFEVETNGEDKEKPKASKEYNQKTLRLVDFVWNDDDEWVKKGVATRSQEFQEEEEAEKETEEEDAEKEAEEEDPREVKPVAEDGSDGGTPVAASPCTQYTLAAGCSTTSGSHETRFALLEASIIDLEDQMHSRHINMWIDFEKIKSLLHSHT